MEEKDSKTEKATPKKLRDARKKGEVPKSQDLTSAITFVVFALLVSLLGQYILEHSFSFLRSALSSDFNVSGLENNLNDIGVKAIVFILILAGPFLAIGFFAALIASLIQTGFLYTTEPLKFSLGKINPISGFKNLFNKKAFFSLLKNLAKLTLVFWMAYSSIESSVLLIVNSGNAGTQKLFFVLMTLLKELAAKLAVLLMVLGIADYAVQFYEHRKKLKMSKQEQKDEYKEMEGDPQIKSKRKQIHRQLSQKTLKDIESSTVIITNPTHLAIAIRYEKGKDEVPLVMAKGADYIAEKIRERAAEHNIPIIENKPVAQAIYKSVKVGQPVPVNLYQALAEIVALVYQMEEIKKHKI